MNFGIGASNWLDAVSWAQQTAAPALFWFAAGSLAGRRIMNGYFMLAGIATVLVGLWMFAVGWGALPS